MTFEEASATIRDRLRSTQDEARGLRDDAAGIAADLRQLLTMEAELAKAEANEAVGHAGRGTAFGVLALEMAMIGVVFLFLTIMFALDTAMDLWLAALITTLIVLAITALFGLLARQQWTKFSPMPQRAIRTMKEDVTWAKSQLRSSAR